MTENPARELALALANAGYPVLPCKSDGTVHWDVIDKEGATKSPTVINAWWSANYSIGLGHKLGGRKPWHTVPSKITAECLEDIDGTINAIKELKNGKGKSKKTNGKAEPDAEVLQTEPVRFKPSRAYTLNEVHRLFQRWLGPNHDLAVVNFTLAVAAGEQLEGDPVWGMIIGAPGGAKTETLNSLRGVNAEVVSTISSEGALMSATPDKDREEGATGGLLPKMGGRGILTIKDFTSILSADRTLRGILLAAFREIYDGRWCRNCGVGGGKTLNWEGRIVVLSAVTTKWDSAYAVIAVMGDRYLSIRHDPHANREESGRQALANLGKEKEMRAELADAVGGLLMTVDPRRVIDANQTEIDHILKLANLVTCARTAAEYERGWLTNVHAPEAPTRLAKQLLQLFRGATVIGLSREAAFELVIRCARDTIPPIRFAVLKALLGTEESLSTVELAEQIGLPRSTIGRNAQALQALRLLEGVAKATDRTGPDGAPIFKQVYALLGACDEEALAMLVRGRP